MTICASVKVRDGLVLGTDSMTQIWGQDAAGNRGVIKAYSNARKLFQIGQLPIGVMTYGIGNLGPRSIQSFIRDFSSRYSGQPDVKSVSQELYGLLSTAYQDQFGDTRGGHLGFFIAGYSPEQVFPEEWEFQLPRDKEIRQVRPGDQFGASWRGVDLPFTRLYKGYDSRIIADLRELGISEEAFLTIMKKYESPVAYDGMPVQDAVDFAIFILQTTIGLSTFELGVPSCGGPLQIATILPEKERFCWVQEPAITAVVQCLDRRK
jgi:hypothetical protein